MIERAASGVALDAVVTSGAALQTPAKPPLAPQTPPASRTDSMALSTLGKVPATAVSLTLDCAVPVMVSDNTRVAPSTAVIQSQVASLNAAPPATRAAINFTDFMQGFATGTKLALSATGFFGSGSVGGSGTVTGLASDQVRMTLDVKSPFGSQTMDIDLRQVNGQYQLLSPAKWDATAVRSGSTVTITNKANAEERITITIPKAGEMRFLTNGLGHDGRTFIAKAK